MRASTSTQSRHLLSRDQPLRANERCASLLPEHGDIGTPDRRQRYDGRSAFHVFCIE